MAKKLVRGKKSSWLNKKSVAEYADSVVFLNGKDANSTVGTNIIQDSVDFAAVGSIKNLYDSENAAITAKRTNSTDNEGKIYLVQSVAEGTVEGSVGKAQEFTLYHKAVTTAPADAVDLLTATENQKHDAGKDVAVSTIQRADLDAANTAEGATDNSATTGAQKNTAVNKVLSNVLIDDTGHVVDVIVSDLQQTDERVARASTHYLPGGSIGQYGSAAAAKTYGGADGEDIHYSNVTEGAYVLSETNKDNVAETSTTLIPAITSLKLDGAHHPTGFTYHEVPSVQYVNDAITEFSAKSLQYKGVVVYGVATTDGDGKITGVTPVTDKTTTGGAWYVKTGENAYEALVQDNVKTGDTYFITGENTTLEQPATGEEGNTVVGAFYGPSNEVFEVGDAIIFNADSNLNAFNKVQTNWSVVSTDNSTWTLTNKRKQTIDGTESEKKTVDTAGQAVSIYMQGDVTNIPVASVGGQVLDASIKTPVTSLNGAVGDLYSHWTGTYSSASATDQIASLGTLTIAGVEHEIFAKSSSYKDGQLIDIFDPADGGDGTVNHKNIPTVLTTKSTANAALTITTNAAPVMGIGENSTKVVGYSAVASTPSTEGATERTANDTTNGGNKALVVTSITTDGFGHVTAITKSDITDENVKVEDTAYAYTLLGVQTDKTSKLGQQGANGKSQSAVNNYQVAVTKVLVSDSISNEGAITTTYSDGGTFLNDSRGSVMSVNATSIDWEEI